MDQANGPLIAVPAEVALNLGVLPSVKLGDAGNMVGPQRDVKVTKGPCSLDDLKEVGLERLTTGHEIAAKVVVEQVAGVVKALCLDLPGAGRPGGKKLAVAEERHGVGGTVRLGGPPRIRFGGVGCG